MQISFNTLLCFIWFINPIFSLFSPLLLVMILFQCLQMEFVHCFIPISWSGNKVLCNSCMGCQTTPQALSSSPTSGTLLEQKPHKKFSPCQVKLSNLHSCIPTLTSLALRVLEYFNCLSWHQTE